MDWSDVFRCEAIGAWNAFLGNPLIPGMGALEYGWPEAVRNRVSSISPFWSWSERRLTTLIYQRGWSKGGRKKGEGREEERKVRKQGRRTGGRRRGGKIHPSCRDLELPALHCSPPPPSFLGKQVSIQGDNSLIHQGSSLHGGGL